MIMIETIYTYLPLFLLSFKTFMILIINNFNKFLNIIQVLKRKISPINPSKLPLFQRYEQFLKTNNRHFLDPYTQKYIFLLILVPVIDVFSLIYKDYVQLTRLRFNDVYLMVRKSEQIYLIIYMSAFVPQSMTDFELNLFFTPLFLFRQVFNKFSTIDTNEN